MGAGEFDALADSLLFRDSTTSARVSLSGTRTPAALQAFARAQRLLEQWELAAADSELASATRSDAQYAQAYLWLAQVRLWNDQPSASWRIAAHEASRHRARLSAHDQLLSDALSALTDGEHERACAIWSQLSRIDSTDFATWYGLGRCLRLDSLVLRDRTSPSGWRFRSSYYQATQAYRKALELLPSIHTALSRGSFEQTRRILATSSTTSLRQGRPAAPDTGLFLAIPGLDHDTLTFTPYPAALVRSGQPGIVPSTLGTAVARQRLVFREIAAGWAAAYPRSARALEAVAISHEMLGDPSALDLLRRARLVAFRPRVSAPGWQSAEVLLRTKLALPSDLTGLRSARALADSLLREERPESTPLPRLMASVAALRGRAQLAATYMRQPIAVALERSTASFASDGLALGMFAAMGGPPDSLRVLEQRIEAAIARAVVDSARQSVLVAWLMRPAVLAFPTYRFPSLGRFTALGWAPLEAQLALVRGDTARVAGILAEAAMRRTMFTPSDLTLDGLYPEAWLLSAIGDDARAVERIDPTLRAVARTSPEMFADPVRAASLVRTAVLRAQLAARAGDRRTARTWARAVAILWSDADPFLQPVVREMGGIAQ